MNRPHNSRSLLLPHLLAWVALFLLLVLPVVQPGSAASPSQDAPAPVPQLRGKKLILKDGTFHVVRSYQLIEPSPDQKSRGAEDRVRYYSVERSSWEELPASLVDWDATRKAEADLSRLTEDLAEKARSAKTAQLVADLDVDSSIQVAEGIFMPEDIGTWVFDGFKLHPLTQNRAEMKLDKGRIITQVLVPIPIIPSRHKVQLPGAAAVIKISNPTPEFFLRTQDAREPDLELIRAQVKGDNRQIEFISTHMTGEKSSKRDTISIERWVLAKGVFRVTLSQPLPPGEYVLAEIVADQGMNLYLWDFSIATASTPARKK